MSQISEISRSCEPKNCMTGLRAGMFWVGIVLMVASGCIPAVTMDTEGKGQTTTQVGQVPNLEQKNTVSVGEAIYSEFSYEKRTGMRLIKPFHDSFGLGARVHVPANVPLVSATVDGQQAYCTPFYAFAEPLMRAPHRRVCFFDRNSDGAFEEYWIPNTIESASRSMAPHKYTRKATIADAGGFKKELIYQGLQEGVIRVSYREYIDNLVRPAFQQELTYTLAKSGLTSVSFRKVRIEIVAADNNQIQYKILRGF